MEYDPSQRRLMVGPILIQTMIVVIRTASCNDVSINGGPSRPAMVAQFGVSVSFLLISDADIDNYTLTYVTDDQELADRLNRAGVRAHWSPQSRYTNITPVANGRRHHWKVNVKRVAKKAAVINYAAYCFRRSSSIRQVRSSQTGGVPIIRAILKWKPYS